MTGHKLIHNANTCADELVLGTLTELCKLDAIDGISALMQEGKSHSNLDGRR